MSLHSITQFCFVVLLISASTLSFSASALAFGAAAPAFVEKEQAELRATGCTDPKYKQFVEERLDYFERKNKRMLKRTQRDYERSSQASSNPYQVIGDLSRHLIYSAQFESVKTINTAYN